MLGMLERETNLFNLIEASEDTVKPVNNGHPRDLKKVAVVQRWSLFGGSKKLKCPFFLSFVCLILILTIEAVYSILTNTITLNFIL
jgi:hypothetical protein